jgi:hypothetical protein
MTRRASALLALHAEWMWWVPVCGATVQQACDADVHELPPSVRYRVAFATPLYSPRLSRRALRHNCCS